MADEIEKQTGIKPVLKKGRGGVFNVTLDGNLLFSKHQKGRFPEHQEVLDQLPIRKT